VSAARRPEAQAPAQPLPPQTQPAPVRHNSISALRDRLLREKKEREVQTQ
jgi:hypothetical protein